MNKTIHIPNLLLLEAQEEGLLKELAIFIGLKHSFSSGHLHSTSNTHLTNLPVCGRARAREVIKLYANKGYIRKESTKGYTFISYKKILKKDRYNTFTMSISSLNHKEIYNQLLKQLLIDKSKHQKYSSKVHQHLTNPETLSQLKAAKSRLKKINYNSGWDNRKGDLNVSYLGIAFVLNVSVGTAYNHVQQLATSREVFISKNIIPTNIPNNLLEHAREANNKVYVLGKQGYLKQVLPNSYTFNVSG